DLCYMCAHGTRARGSPPPRSPGPRDPPATASNNPHLKTLRVFFVDTEKLPFAGYSVVKEPSKGFAPRITLGPRRLQAPPDLEFRQSCWLASPKPRRQPRSAKAGRGYTAR